MVREIHLSMATESRPTNDMTRVFDRPVFIMAAPRSCSSLLFQTLAQSESLWSLGDESHQIFEGHPKLSPGRGFVDSNRLTADLLDPVLARSITARFAAQLVDRTGRRFEESAGRSIRLLEKTPKHALRIPFIDALFPDALFIYLFRDPRENISSIIEAWRSGRFVTYRRFQTAHGPWSLLLPPGWRDQVDKPLEEIAAFQWQAANRHIIDDLGRIEPSRWTAFNAAELLLEPVQAIARLCAFMDIGFDAGLRTYLERPLPPSRYTVSAPIPDKWRDNTHLLARIWPQVAGLVPEINRFVAGKAQPLVVHDALPADEVATSAAPRHLPAPASPIAGKIRTAARNEACPCGSGRRYKQCHGRLA
jgi:hypothetical protein